MKLLVAHRGDGPTDVCEAVPGEVVVLAGQRGGWLGVSSRRWTNLARVAEVPHSEAELFELMADVLGDDATGVETQEMAQRLYSWPIGWPDDQLLTYRQTVEGVGFIEAAT